MGKKKADQPEAKWRHSAEAVEKGKVSYNCKFWGNTPVSASKGSELIKESIKKLQFANDIKKSEEGLRASKLKKVELCVSTQNLVITDVKSKTTLYSFPLQRVSYCADDKTSKKLFGFIARDKESPQHQCYILECEKNAEELTLAVGQAFELAYKRYKESQVAGKDVNQMKQRVESTEKENEVLRKRLEELEKGQKQTPPPLASMVASVDESNGQGNTSQPPAQQTFDPFAESAAPAFQSSSFDIQSPPPYPTDTRPLPPSVGANPFALPTEPAASSNNQGDLLDIFGGEPQASNAPPQEDDIFDPLAQVNGAAQAPPSQPNLSSFDLTSPPAQPNFSSFDQASAAEPNFSSFDASPPSQSNEMQVTSVSRPKPAALSGGLLPPPPTKQSIKERNRNSNLSAEQTNGAPVHPGLNTQAEVQPHGVENNLVLF